MSKAFSELLREARLARGWSQEETARRIGVAVATYNAWERGRRMPRSQIILERIREVLGVSPEPGNRPGSL